LKKQTRNGFVAFSLFGVIFLTLTILYLNKSKGAATQGRRQKIFQGGAMKKSRPRNSTNKLPSTLSMAG